MDAIKALAEAADRAKEILAELLDNSYELAERARLESMSKEELISELMAIKARNSQMTTVEECALRILEDEKCVWLSYEMIAALINRVRPGTKTTTKCIAWYFSRENCKRDDARPVRLRRKLSI